MHEISIAHSLVELVMEQLVVHGIDNPAAGRVAAVRVRIGVRSAVIPSALRSAFRAAVRDTPLEGARLDIELVAACGWCVQCRRERTLPDPRKLRCPDCGGPVPRLIGGQELEVSSVELRQDAEKEYADAASNPASAPANPQEK